MKTSSWLYAGKDDAVDDNDHAAEFDRHALFEVAHRGLEVFLCHQLRNRVGNRFAHVAGLLRGEPSGFEAARQFQRVERHCIFTGPARA
jgi:hypothetical protein